jgi:hypothetical protein
VLAAATGPSFRLAVAETGAAATGGVEAARYAKAPSGGGIETHIPSIATSPSKTAVPHLVRDAALGMLVLIMASVLFVGFLAADSLGLGPRHPEWRNRQRWRWRRLWR